MSYLMCVAASASLMGRCEITPDARGCIGYTEKVMIFLVSHKSLNFLFFLKCNNDVNVGISVFF